MLGRFLTTKQNMVVPKKKGRVKIRNFSEKSYNSTMFRVQSSQSSVSSPLPPPPPLCQNAGELGDKGVVAVPVEFIETSGGGDGGTPAIDWTAIEAANAGTQPPSDTDEEYARRILFSRVSDAWHANICI